MNKYILTLILISMNYFLFAQQHPILRTVSIQDTHMLDFDLKEGDYIKDTYNQLNPYIGTWKYEGSDKVLVLKIQKVSMFYNKTGEFFDDTLLVTYKYIKYGTVLVDNLNAPIINSYDGLSKSDSKRYGTFGLSRNESFIIGSIRDIPLNILTRAEIHPVNFGVTGETPKIKIYYNLLNSLKGNPASFYVGKPSFELPNNVELIKQ